MQLILSTDSPNTDIKKMTSLKESVIEQPFVNGTSDSNDVTNHEACNILSADGSVFTKEVSTGSAEDFSMEVDHDDSEIKNNEGVSNVTDTDNASNGCTKTNCDNISEENSRDASQCAEMDTDVSDEVSTQSVTGEKVDTKTSDAIVSLNMDANNSEATAVNSCDKEAVNDVNMETDDFNHLPPCHDTANATKDSENIGEEVSMDTNDVTDKDVEDASTVENDATKAVTDVILQTNGADNTINKHHDSETFTQKENHDLKQQGENEEKESQLINKKELTNSKIDSTVPEQTVNKDFVEIIEKNEAHCDTKESKSDVKEDKLEVNEKNVTKDDVDDDGEIAEEAELAKEEKEVLPLPQTEAETGLRNDNKENQEPINAVKIDISENKEIEQCEVLDPKTATSQEACSTVESSDNNLSLHSDSSTNGGKNEPGILDNTQKQTDDTTEKPISINSNEDRKMDCDDVISTKSELKEPLEDIDTNSETKLAELQQNTSERCDNIDEDGDEKKSSDENKDVEMTADETSIVEAKANDEIVDLVDDKDVEFEAEKALQKETTTSETPQKTDEKNSTGYNAPGIILSNTLDILSDDDEEPTKASAPAPAKEEPKKVAQTDNSDKQRINLGDDDDIMVIDDVTSKDEKTETAKESTENTSVANTEFVDVKDKSINESEPTVPSDNKEPDVAVKSCDKEAVNDVNMETDNFNNLSTCNDTANATKASENIGEEVSMNTNDVKEKDIEKPNTVENDATKAVTDVILQTNDADDAVNKHHDSETIAQKENHDERQQDKKESQLKERKSDVEKYELETNEKNVSKDDVDDDGKIAEESESAKEEKVVLPFSQTEICKLKDDTETETGSKNDNKENQEPINAVKADISENKEIEKCEALDPKTGTSQEACSTVEISDKKCSDDTTEKPISSNSNDDHKMDCDDVISINSESKEPSLEVIDTNPETKAAGLLQNALERCDIIDVDSDEKKSSDENKDVDETSKVDAKAKDEIVDLVDDKDVEMEAEKTPQKETTTSETPQKTDEEKNSTGYNAPGIKLSNTLDILSDDDEEPTKALAPAKKEPKKVPQTDNSDKQCINLDDDDDIMVIDDVTSKDEKKETAKESTENTSVAKTEFVDVKDKSINESEPTAPTDNKEPDVAEKPDSSPKSMEEEKISVKEPEPVAEKPKPLIPENFFKTYKKNLAEMTRDDLEEFCILKIVESIIDRSNLNEIKTKVKTLAASVEEHKKKSWMFVKQNRDLQVVLKSLQEEQKKKPNAQLTPLKITRSVGMQVSISEVRSRKVGMQTNVIRNAPPTNTINTTNNRPQRNVVQNQRAQKPATNTQAQTIPVPRLVPAPNTNKPAQNNTPKASSSPVGNGVKILPAPKAPEKRTRAQSVTVDLTDDEPPAKQMATKTSPVPPVRVVPSQNLMAARPQPQIPQNSPRKVYIPISGPQSQIRPGQTVMLKGMAPAAPRTRPPMVRVPQSSVRVGRVVANRHPAPLPDAVKQYQPPNWKALPPAPDLKLSKVENGIVISWKIDGYQDDSYEEIASYQLYAYQETSSPPNTALWKKIGDVKALPLPMACTLTQFMAGYKYYFAVRAVDVRSRLGPFSLPGSILLLNKM